jgi:hypothetical protein
MEVTTGADLRDILADVERPSRLVLDATELTFNDVPALCSFLDEVAKGAVRRLRLNPSKSLALPDEPAASSWETNCGWASPR